MAVGCLITVDSSSRVILRQPLWPWPRPSEYPRLTTEGHMQYFFPVGYWRFRLGDTLDPAELSHLTLEPQSK